MRVTRGLKTKTKRAGTEFGGGRPTTAIKRREKGIATTVGEANGTALRVPRRP